MRWIIEFSGGSRDQTTIVAWLRAILILTALVGLNVTTARAATPKEFLAKYCVDCHGSKLQRGGVRLDDLSTDFSKVADAEVWTGVMDQLNGGTMPPKGKPRPAQSEVDTVTVWVASELRKAEGERSEARLRRLSRYEYTRTLQDLLGILYTVPEDFPPDPNQHGFDNNSQALAISPIHLQKYLSVADEALEVAMGLRYRAPGSVPAHVFDPSEESWKYAFGRHRWDVKGQKLKRAVLTPGQFGDMNRNYWHTGVQTIRATVSALPGSNYSFPPRLVVTINQRRILDIAVTGTLEKPQKIEHHYFDRGNDVRFEFSNGAILSTGEGHGQPHKLNDDEINKYRSTVPCLVVDHMELDGSDSERWPPASVRRIFFQGDDAPKDRAYAREIVARFMERAYRRRVARAEIDRICSLVEKEAEGGATFEVAVKCGLRAVLCSPHFLFLAEGVDKPDAKKVTGRELASRLSYFLWSSMPDAELSRLADNGTLGRPDVLRAQVNRMLAAPRADALAEKFCVGWLELHKLGNFTPDRFLYPIYEVTLEKAMAEETKAFFRIILQEDLDVTNFIKSDWAALNERMARHYGIPGVNHDDFRRVKLPSGSHRGGLLTQASILTLTGDGLRTKPVTRGKWILDNMLGTPPPPPPPNAGELPNIPEFSQLPIREQLRRHREIESCAACHARIDPFGFVLENYDAIGSWRDRAILPDPKLPKHAVTGYESDGQLIAWAHEGRKVPIDASSVLPGGKSLKGAAGLQDDLLEHKDQFLHCLAEKMFVYATGRASRYSDRPVVDELASRLAKYKTLRGLIQDIVATPIFQTR